MAGILNSVEGYLHESGEDLDGLEGDFEEKI